MSLFYDEDLVNRIKNLKTIDELKEILNLDVFKEDLNHDLGCGFTIIYILNRDNKEELLDYIVENYLGNERRHIYNGSNLVQKKYVNRRIKMSDMIDNNGNIRGGF